MQGLGGWSTRGYDSYSNMHTKSGSWQAPWQGFARSYGATLLPEDIATVIEEMATGCEGAKEIANLDWKSSGVSNITAATQELAQRRMGTKLRLLLDKGFLCQSDLDACGIKLDCKTPVDCQVKAVTGPIACKEFQDAIKMTSTGSGKPVADVNKTKATVGNKLAGIQQRHDHHK